MRVALIGVAISIALGMALSGELVFEKAEQVRFEDNFDAIWSATACTQADLGTALSWWYRPWLPEHYLLYRPLYTGLMWIEAKLWGFSFFPYTIVSWVIHGLNCALVFLLLYSLCRGPWWQRLGAGVFGVLMFSLGRDAAGVWGPAERVPRALMPFWPVQTDLASLTGALLALLCLDRYLLYQQRWAAEPDLPRRHGLFVGACAAFLAALLFKETALAVWPVAVLLAWHRGRPWRTTALAFGALGVAYFVARALVLPQSPFPPWLGGRSVSVWVQYVHLLSGELLTQGEIWEFATLVTLVPLVVVLWRKRVSITYIVLLCLIWPFIWAGVLTGNPFLATIKREMTILVRFAGVYGGLSLALLSGRREPLLPLIAGLIAVGAGSIEHFGPHYWYWPVALWGLIDGAALNAVANQVRAWRQAQRAA